MHQPMNWYHTALSRVSDGEARRRSHALVADGAFEPSTRAKFDPYVSGAGWAAIARSGRAALMP